MNFFARLILVVGAGFLVSCENDIDKVNLLKVEHLPLVSQTDAVLNYSDSAVIRMRLNAKLLERYEGEDPYLEMKKGMNIYLFDIDGDTTTQMKANYAIKYDKKKTMVAKGNVVVVNAQGEQLDTEELTWDEANQKIFTKAFVKITTNDKIIMGEGMEANQFFTKYKINKIKGIIKVKQDQ
jgi:LPS export ABC transporter protein LptC